MGANRLRLALLSAALCMATVAGAPGAHLLREPHRLAPWPRNAGSPTFSLVDTRGKPRTLGDYRGQVVVMYFGFLHCPDACPSSLHKLALVVKRLGPVATQVRVLFVTLDPERDSPTLLRRYVSGFDPRFIGLTGTSAQVDQAASSFHVQYARVPLEGGYTINHSTATLVLDRTGRLRLVGAADATVEDLVHDIRSLAAQRPGQ